MAILSISHVMKSTGYEHQNHKIRVFRQSLQIFKMKEKTWGPAMWYAGRNQYMVNPITSFKAMQGWSKDARSGQLKNPLNPKADSIEHTIAFMVKEPLKPAGQ
jgi:hypothetical protein